MSEQSNTRRARLERAGIIRILTVFSALLIYGVILFGVAGRLDWWEAWAYLAINLAGVAFTGLWSLRHNPDVINERGRMGKNTKGWDKVIGVLYTFVLAGSLALTGLDARYGWSEVPLWVNILGAIGIIISLGMAAWAMTANTFLSTFVRIQEERGHTTVSSGPYRYIRHPMYFGMLFMSLGMPLLLGSWWAVIPGGLNILLFFIRTMLEDRTLQAELPGYSEYAKKVRYRLVPGIW